MTGTSLDKGVELDALAKVGRIQIGPIFCQRAVKMIKIELDRMVAELHLGKLGGAVVKNETEREKGAIVPARIALEKALKTPGPQ